MGRPPETGVGATRRPWTSRLSAGHVVMVLAGVLGALLTLAVLRSAEDTERVVVTSDDVAPGTVVEADTFVVREVRADTELLATLVRPADVDALEGQVVTSALEAGALVRHGDVRPAAAGAARRSMSFPVVKSRAVNGTIARGDRVDVVAVDQASGEPEYVVVDAEVLDVDRTGGQGPLGGGDELTVTLAVGGDEPLRIAAAVDSGTLTLVRATGAAPLEGGSGLASPAGAP